MESTSIIDRLKYICSDKYSEETFLFTLYIDIIQYKDYIREKTSPELYQRLCSELECVYYESRFGDGEYTDIVFSDCISVLKEIVEGMGE